MSRRGWATAAIALLTVVFIVDRLLVLAGSGPLMVAVDPAEYGFLTVAVDHSVRPLFDTLTDPDHRAALLSSSRRVANQVHGTLGLMGTVITGLVGLGAPPTTQLLRGVALAQSGLTTALWLGAIWRATRSLWSTAVFGLLAVLAGPVWLELTVLCWGTHDTVALLQAGVVFVALPWIARPPTGVVAGARALSMGLLLGAAVLANAALVLPATSALVGVCLSSKAPTSRRAIHGLSALVAAAVFAQIVLYTGVLDGLGYPRVLPLLDSGGLIGKSDTAFLHKAPVDPAAGARWLDEARRQALVQAPTAAYGAHATLAEGLSRGAGLLAAAWLCVKPNRVGRFLGLHLLLGLAATLVLTRLTALDPTVSTGAPPRYFAHLYPFAAATVAVLVSERRVVGLVLTAWLAWTGAFEHARLLDPARYSPAELAEVAAYDGALAWWSQQGSPTQGALSLPRSPAFRAGYATITALHDRRYWHGRRPRELAREPDEVGWRVSGAIEADPTFHDDPEYWEGVGCALRVVVPPSRMPLAAAVWRRHRAWSEEMKRGYSAGAAALSAPTRDPLREP